MVPAVISASSWGELLSVSLRSSENSHRLTEGLMSGKLHSSRFYKSLFAGNETMRAARANHNISLSKKQKTQMSWKTLQNSVETRTINTNLISCSDKSILSLMVINSALLTVLLLARFKRKKTLLFLFSVLHFQESTGVWKLHSLNSIYRI